MKEKTCSNCNHVIPSSWELCLYCGEWVLDAICSNCGHKIPSSWELCLYCGEFVVETETSEEALIPLQTH